MIIIEFVIAFIIILTIFFAIFAKNEPTLKENNINSFLNKIKNEFKQININSNLEIKPTQIYHGMPGIYTGFYIDTYHSSNEIAIPMILLTLKNLATKEKIEYKETDLSYFDGDVPETPALNFILNNTSSVQLIFQNLEYSNHPLNGVGIMVCVHDVTNYQL